MVTWLYTQTYNSILQLNNYDFQAFHMVNLIIYKWDGQSKYYYKLENWGRQGLRTSYSW